MDMEDVICIGREYGKDKVLSAIMKEIEKKFLCSEIEVCGVEDVDTEYGVFTILYEIELEHEEGHFDSETLQTIVPSYDRIESVNIISVQ